jgi:hypothetical protein
MYDPASAAPRPPLAAAWQAPRFIGMVCLFWVFVTLSNLLYAYSMRVGLGSLTKEPLFVTWNVRVLQHLLLLPVFAGAVWASLRIRWRPRWIAIPLQLLLGAGFAALAYPALIAGMALLGDPQFTEHMAKHDFAAGLFDPAVLLLWVASFVSFIPAYGFGVALITGFALYSRFRDAELQVAALEREWSAARLAALRMQLSPHSLFNLLHTIRGLIEWDPQGAQSMVVQLADLLRRLLRAGERDFVPLADELHVVSLYLQLQQKRFADRLSLQLPDPAALPAVWVPSLILQPLVENAVLHGLAGHQGAVRIRIEAHASAGSLLLEVINTTAPDKAPGERGIGLENVRERLAVQFGSGARMTAGAVAGEWRVRITLPAIGGLAQQGVGAAAA